MLDMSGMPEPTVSFSLRLTPDQFRRLDARARHFGTTRADLMRQMIDMLIEPAALPAPERDAA